MPLPVALSILRPTGLILLTLGSVVVHSVAHSPFVHFEGRQTHPVAVSFDGMHLLALNTPHARLAVYDISNAANSEPVLVAEIPVGLEPVSVRQRTADEVWVVNEVSDSISVISLSRGCVTDTIAVPDEPADIVFANGKAFVTCAQSKSIRVLDPISHAETGSIPVDGNSPRALAVSTDGQQLFVACLLSGNGTTTLPAALAPAPPPPTNAALPPAPQTGLIVTTGDPRLIYSVTDHDVAEINTSTNAIIHWHSDVGTNLFDLAVHPATGDVWVANTDARNAVRFQPNLRAHAVDNRIARIVHSTNVVSNFDLNPDVDYTVQPNPSAAAVALAQPTALLWAADGSHGWLAAYGSDRIAKLGADGSVLGRVDLRPAGADTRSMRGPRGLALHPSRPRLYVLNRMSNSVSVIDTIGQTVLAEIAAGSRSLMPDYIAQGRGYLYDARLSAKGTMSCASCHIDGDRDGLAWDLGNPGGVMTTVGTRSYHPMKGPMLTPTLRGAAASPPYNWRGDHGLLSINSHFANKLGGNPLPITELQVLLDYLVSLNLTPNPNRQLDNTLPPALGGGSPEAGKAKFEASSSKCTTCHTGTRGSNYTVPDPALTGSVQFFRVAPLHTLYQRGNFTPAAGSTLSGFGYLHDGSQSLLPMVHPTADTSLTGADFADVAAYLHCMDTNTVPAVGFNRTATLTNRASSSLNVELSTLEEQASLGGRVDAVARGRWHGRLQAFLWSGEDMLWHGDRNDEPGLSRTELLAEMVSDDVLTFLGVPPYMGKNYSIDQDDSEILDGDDRVPPTSLTQTADGMQLHGPGNFGWVPEWNAALNDPWQTLTTPTTTRDAVESAFPIPMPEATRRFFRFRRTW
jgi:YVTN family beta-propeller protein